MNDLTAYILPYPYEAYTEFNRHRQGFEQYKKKIYTWVENNSRISSNIEFCIELAFSYVENSKSNKDIKIWLNNHIDKLRYIGDFSGLDFGIMFYQETEEILLRFPTMINEDDKQLYPLYDENEFKDMKIIDKLEWMYIHCEFIPFRIIYEDINPEYTSHKFSHIKRDTFSMNLLKDYLEESEFQPKDNIFYFIKLNPKSKKYYLKRDLYRSPKYK